jgi:hypothetical protein
MTTFIPTTPNFIKLAKRKLFVTEFEKVKESTTSIERLRVKDQTQHLNLMLVDSVFPEILGYAAQIASRNGKLKLQQLVDELVRINHFHREYANLFYKRKFYDFVHLLLYSNLNGRTVCQGKLDYSRIYCFKDVNGQLQFLNCYEQNVLVEIVIENCICTVKSKASSRDSRKLNFTLQMPSELSVA